MQSKDSCDSSSFTSSSKSSSSFTFSCLAFLFSSSSANLRVHGLLIQDDCHTCQKGQCNNSPITLSYLSNNYRKYLLNNSSVSGMSTFAPVLLPVPSPSLPLPLHLMACIPNTHVQTRVLPLNSKPKCSSEGSGHATLSSCSSFGSAFLG